MTKRFGSILAIVAIVAMAVPAASGAAEVTYPAGTRAPVGTVFTATGTNVELNSSTLGPIVCSTLNLEGNLGMNNGTEFNFFANNIPPVQAGCHNGANSVRVTQINLTRLFSNSTGSGTASFTAKIDVGTKLVCDFTGTYVPFLYSGGSDVIKFSSSAGVTSPGCGSARLTGSFTLEHGATPIILD